MIGDLQKLTRLIDREPSLKNLVSWNNIGKVSSGETHHDILQFSIGATAPTLPVLFITGGIHGLERIGAQLAWSLLKTTIDRLLWDKSLRDLFQNLRLVIIPLVNPFGYQNNTRSNANGVDLMRNAPVQAIERAPWPLGGQIISNRLPWFRGHTNNMEEENKILVNSFLTETAKSECVVALDFHSGFGLKDRIWFPFSHTITPFDYLSEMASITRLFEETHPYHVYKIEPQAKAYLINGDIWDYLFFEFKKKNANAVFLPLTLEMGSWSWVRKNPLQLLSRQGIFNPMKEHRLKRTFRRHHLLFDFLLKALNSNAAWSKLTESGRKENEQHALQRWYC